MKFLNRVRLIKKEPEIVLGLLDLVIGKYIGSGCYRDVYHHTTNDKWVVKIKNGNKYENRGRFNSIDEAKQERDRALAELGYSEIHGRELSKLPYRKV